jgi:two-component system, LuxR family, response regulator FixJ
MIEGTVYIVDDDLAVRESIDALLCAEGYVTAAFGSPREFLERFEPEGVACVLLDVRMPEMNGLAVLERLAPTRRGTPVIMMTAHGDVPMAVRAMQAGAVDFVEKPFEKDRLLASIERATAAAAPSAPAADAAPDPGLRARFEQLTPREMDVMRQLVIGHPNKVIGHNLGMSPRTVEIHRGRVMEKTGAESLSHLVRMAIRAGFDPDAGHKEIT